MDTQVKSVEVLPLVKYYMEQLELARLFDKFVPNRNGAEVAPAQVLCLLVMNIMVSARPLYRVEDWLHDYLDGVTEERVEAAKYNDDRLGRNLDLLFAADRASFLTELSAKAIVVHQLETETIHNDSTSVTFLGAYDADDPKAVKITHGYNKDHRPDCKQIVFGLNITGDGHVPLGDHLYDGNQADVTTHIPNWQQLRELLDREDLIYVADSKLCAEENLKTIADSGGRFITVVPRHFREVKDFLARVRNGEDIVWQYRHEVPDSRQPDRTEDAPGDAGAAHRAPTPAACWYANEKTDLAHDHGLVSRRPSSDRRTLRQGDSDRTQRAERITTADPGTAESADHNLHKPV